MSDFTQLVGTDPIVTPPVPEIVWDKRWISMLTLVSDEVNAIRLYAKLIPCRDISEAGDKQIKSPLVDGDAVVVTIENVWAIIGTNPKFAMAMELIFQSVNEYGIQQGVLKDPNAVVPQDADSSTSSLSVTPFDSSSESSSLSATPFDTSSGSSESSQSSQSPVA